MAIQLSVTVRNARLDQIESTIGTAPTLEIRSGSPPANCAAADTGTVLATLTLPSDWMAVAASGSKAISGTWQDLSCDNTGTAGHFRIKAGSTCHLQGTCTATGGGGDMEVSPGVSITAGQSFTVNTFTLTDGGA
jgi:hypothetical protein